MQSSDKRTLIGGLLGMLVGLIVSGSLGLALMGTLHDVEVEVPTIICPPRLETATKVDITAYYQGMPPELTDIDREFEKACGLEWGEPHRVEPPESGA